MIPKETIDKIFDTSRIEEVVGDFVSLKKRGVNLLGLCPFHNEKTPSFTVSPAKGIYKCFGCGKAGNSVNFIMDHEQLNYPEALRYLAKKYHIEIEEEEQTPEKIQAQNERESLFLVSAFAQKHFSENLWTTDEGKSIGLGYFKERGFREDIIEKFQLGYSFDTWRGLTDAAINAGYKPEYLVKAGLIIEKSKDETSSETTIAAQPQRYFDRFMGRVIFPIHNITGRVIGFGGRILKNDKKAAKYINSPESEIYHKSNVLYGIYFAKQSIIREDTCFLVEGYTDVISMHQAGIENVVASSGTSLTTGQIQLIRRYTTNITILYDGDNAGIKASFRGIDMILEEGMNVKVLLFPDGDDPDSYSKKVTGDELRTFIKNNTKDFIAFKTQLLLGETSNDPIKKAGLIKDIVASIALIPEAITRSVYVKECSQLMGVEEQVLLTEITKIRRTKLSDKHKTTREEAVPETPPEFADSPPEEPERHTADGSEYQEKDIIRLLLCFGNKKINVEGVDEQGQPVEMEITVAEFIVSELTNDSLTFDHKGYQKIFDFYSTGTVLKQELFTQHPDKEISEVAIHLLTSPYNLSQNWEKKHGILVQTEEMLLRRSVYNAIYSLKARKIQQLLNENEQKLKQQVSDDELLELLGIRMELEKLKKSINSFLGRIIVK